MAGPNLPQRTTANTSAEHVADHNAAHPILNEFDTTIVNATNGQTLVHDGTTFKAVDAAGGLVGRVPLSQAPTGYQYHGTYASAIAQTTLAAYLTSIGAPGRTDFRINIYGQTEGQADILWLRDPQDTVEIAPAP